MLFHCVFRISHRFVTQLRGNSSLCDHAVFFTLVLDHYAVSNRNQRNVTPFSTSESLRSDRGVYVVLW